jgi:class 3 adenylate cyclase
MWPLNTGEAKKGTAQGMPTYIDIHDITGLSPADIAKAHEQDLKTQDQHGVDYVKYWVNQKQGKLYCLCHAPNAEAADRVHQEAHGFRATRILEVTDDIADAFMGDAPADTVGAALVPGSQERDPGTRTILFTDIVESTSMTQRLGDEVAFALLEVHDRIVRASLSTAGGREVKHTGDGIMGVFSSAFAGVRCAMEVQQTLARHRRDEPERPLFVRIGLASGEPIERANDLFGSTVQLAARLCSHAAPGQILVSNAVAELCIGKALAMTDMGPLALKGFDQPVRAHAVLVAL